MAALVEVRHLTKHFLPSRLWLLSGAKVIKAVEDVSLSIQEGTVFGLVGESGCGKTTLGRLILRLIEPLSGQIFFEGQDVTRFSRHGLFEYRRKAQIIFQNPFASLNPRRSIEDSLSVGYQVYKIAKGKERRERLVRLLERVGLGAEALDRYPHQYSGGQLQRIVIARALTVEPKFIVADEPVSALDVSIQAQVLNLMRSLQEDFNFTMLLITHDLRVIYHMSDEIGVMYLGRLVEVSTKQQLYDYPLHPYTQMLISSAPKIDARDSQTRELLKGEVSDQPPPPEGCVFYHRCPIATPECATAIPDLVDKEDGHSVACWRV